MLNFIMKIEMKKNVLLIALAIFCIAASVAQNNANNETKDETITRLQNNIVKLEKEVEYYKKTLDLLNSKIVSQDQNVEFKINSVIGDSNTGKVDIEGILINNGVLRSIQGQLANCIDPQGNETITYQLTVGAGRRLEQLNREIPVKFVVTFKSIPKTPLISALTLKYYSSVDFRNNDISVMFRNISIDWN